MNESRLSLQSVYQDPNFSEFGKPFDASLRTDDGTEFKVYSVLLSTHSEFFKILFSLDEEIGKEGTTIHGIERDIFETVLVYLYTSRVNLTPENMLELLVASDYLMIESLLSECRLFILINKSVENCVRVFLTAHRIKELEIEYRYRRFLITCFEKALQHSMDVASDFPYRVLKYFLRSRSLNVSGERTIWSLIEAWVEMDAPNRMQKVPELLRFLNMEEIEDDLASDMISSSIILQNPLYKDIGDPRVTLAYLSDKHKAQTIIIYRNEAPIFAGVRLPQSVHFITKRSSRVEMFITYDDNLDLWRKVGDMSFRRLKLLRVEHRVYIIEEGAGEDFHRGFRGAFYDLLRDETTTMAQIRDFPAYYKFVVELSGRIYVFGEFSTGTVRYDEETDEWTNIPAISGLDILEAVGLNNCLYVLGFVRMTLPFSLLMKLYDPSTETCSDVSSPLVGRVHFAAVVHQERIFLVGGYDLATGNWSAAVEVYDPFRNEWETYPELLYHYRDVSCMVWNGRLYVYDYRRSWTPVIFWDDSGGWKELEDPFSEMVVTQYRFCSIEGENLVREVMKKNKETDVFDWEESGM